jgi:hypothetical protein
VARFPMSGDTIIAGLTAPQADELACMVRGAGYLRVRVPHVPVGTSATGSPVFACVGCARTTHSARPEVYCGERHRFPGSAGPRVVGAVRLHRADGAGRGIYLLPA